MDKRFFFAFLFSVTGSVLILLGSGLFRPSTWLRATPQCKPEQRQGCFIWCQLEGLLQDCAAFSTRSASSRGSASFGVSSSPGAPPLLLPVLTSMAESDNSGSCAPRCDLQRAPEGCWCQVWIRHWVSRDVRCKNSLFSWWQRPRSATTRGAQGNRVLISASWDLTQFSFCSALQRVAAAAANLLMKHQGS